MSTLKFQIITLCEPIPSFDREIRPICLPTNPTETYIGRIAIATGWGKMLNGNSPNRLRKVNVKIISQDECKRRHSFIK